MYDYPVYCTCALYFSSFGTRSLKISITTVNTITFSPVSFERDATVPKELFVIRSNEHNVSIIIKTRDHLNHIDANPCYGMIKIYMQLTPTQTEKECLRSRQQLLIVMYI